MRKNLYKYLFKYSMERTLESQRLSIKSKICMDCFLTIQLFPCSREERDAVIEKAKEMFSELDDSGDGEMSLVKRQNKYLKFCLYIILNVEDEFVEGCMKDEDLVKMLSETWPARCIIFKYLFSKILYLKSYLHMYIVSKYLNTFEFLM